MTIDVQLREETETDAPIVFEHQADDEAHRMAVFPKRDWDAFLEHWGRTARNRGVLRRIIVADGEVAGSIASFESSDMTMCGYVLGRSHWGRGIATLALRAFLLVETRRPLHAYVAVRNVRSRRVLEKNGFVTVREVTSPPDAHDVVVDELLVRLD